MSPATLLTIMTIYYSLDLTHSGWRSDSYPSQLTTIPLNLLCRVPQGALSVMMDFKSIISKKWASITCWISSYIMLVKVTHFWTFGATWKKYKFCKWMQLVMCPLLKTAWNPPGKGNNIGPGPGPGPPRAGTGPRPGPGRRPGLATGLSGNKIANCLAKFNLHFMIILPKDTIAKI